MAICARPSARRPAKRTRFMIDRSLFSLPGIRRALALLAALALALGLLAVAQALALSRAIVALWSGGALEDALAPAAAFLGCFATRQLVRGAQDAQMERYARERAGELRRSLLERLYDEGPELANRMGAGNAAATALEGVASVESYLELILPKMVQVAVVPLVILIALFLLDPISSVIALAAYPVTILYMVMLGKTAQERAARRHEEFARLSNHFIDSLRGLETLRLFGRSREQAGRIYATSERFRAATMKTIATATLSSALLDLIATFGLAGIAIILGFRLSSAEMGLAPALAVLVLVPDYFAPLRAFASDFHASLDGKNALAGIIAVLDGPLPEACTARIAPWGASSSLALRGVGYRYARGEERALERIDLSFRGFERVAVVGLSGAGKSTLARLVAGFASVTDGTIELDGQDTRSLRHPAWHDQVAYIAQRPHIFRATLRENLAFYRPDAGDGEIRDATRKLGLQDLIDDLEDGLDTMVGDGARRLSGGEAHRVALCRALLDPRRRILILDEPTAHLDIETEHELKERILPLFEGRLVIFATHRLHWVRDMDRVIVLNRGRIVADGAPDEMRSGDTGYLALARDILGDAAPTEGGTTR